MTPLPSSIQRLYELNEISKHIPTIPEIAKKISKELQINSFSETIENLPQQCPRAEIY